MSHFPFHNNWLLQEIDEGYVKELSIKTSLPVFITRFLLCRGIDTIQGIDSHLNSSLDSIGDPFKMSGMDRAVKRLSKAINNKEKIGIFGDYDCDGITASVLLYEFFTQLGSQVFSYIPHREKEGYGMNQGGIDYLHQKGCSLIVTVDCGISNLNEVEYAKSLGIDVIVTDHHEQPDVIPDAYSVIDPKQKNCPFPFKHLAGVGVAFNLARALRRFLVQHGYKGNIKLKPYLDLVALGTLADYMPLLGDNRMLVKAGIEEIYKQSRVGINALCSLSSSNTIRSVQDICFRLIPKINSASRMDSADISFKLLTSYEYSEAMQYAGLLEQLNKKRIDEEKIIFKEALDQLKEYITANGEKKGYVLSSDKWKKGLVGIIATKIMSECGLPVILFTIDGTDGYGSGRGPFDLNLLEIVKELEKHLITFGGHQSAMGLHISADNIDEFRSSFEEKLENAYTPGLKGLSVDFKTTFQEISDPKIVSFYELLEPFGPSYSQPVFTIEGFRVKEHKILKERHLKLLLMHDTLPKHSNYELICWDINSNSHNWEDLELACTAAINNWNGHKKFELRLKDARRRGE